MLVDLWGVPNQTHLREVDCIIFKRLMAQKPYTSDNKEVCGDMRGWGGGEVEGLILSNIIDWRLNREGGQLER